MSHQEFRVRLASRSLPAVSFLDLLEDASEAADRLTELEIAAERPSAQSGLRPSKVAQALHVARAEAALRALSLVAASTKLAAEQATTTDALAGKSAAVLALPGSLDDHAPLIRSLAADILRHLGRPVPDVDPVEREAEVLAVSAEITDLSVRAASAPHDLRAATSSVLQEARNLNALLRRRSAALATMPAATSHGLAAKARAALSLDAATGDDLWFRALARSVLRDAAPLRAAAASTP